MFQLAKQTNGVRTNQRVEFDPDKMNDDYFVSIEKELVENFELPVNLEIVKTVTESIVFQKTSDHEIFRFIRKFEKQNISGL